MVPRLLRGTPGVVKAVRVPDPRTVQIVLALPYAPLLTVLAHPALGIARVTTAADGSTRWVGTGPYLLAESVPGRVTLEANPAYWGGSARSSRLLLVEQADEARALADLDARALDAYVPVAGPSRLAGALAVPGWRIGYLAMQTEREPFARRRIRQGVAVALEQSAIARALDPVAIPLTTMLPPGMWGHVPGPAPAADGRGETARRLFTEGGGARDLGGPAGDAAGAAARRGARRGVAAEHAGLQWREPHGVDAAADRRASGSRRTESIRWSWRRQRATAVTLTSSSTRSPPAKAPTRGRGRRTSRSSGIPAWTISSSGEPALRPSRAPARLRPRPGHARRTRRPGFPLRSAALDGGAARGAQPPIAPERLPPASIARSSMRARARDASAAHPAGLENGPHGRNTRELRTLRG